MHSSRGSTDYTNPNLVPPSPAKRPLLTVDNPSFQYLLRFIAIKLKEYTLAYVVGYLNEYLNPKYLPLSEPVKYYAEFKCYYKTKQSSFKYSSVNDIFEGEKLSNASINDNSALELETEEQTPAVWMQGKGREAMDVELPIQKRNKWTKLTSLETKKRKYEEQKFIANSFCDRGIDYQAAVYHYPKMTPKIYRCYVYTINNQTINYINHFLTYECNLRIEKLNRDQKRSMRTQLTKIREWLGNRDMSQLGTYYKFIARHYNTSIIISEQYALNLYRTIVQIIKCPYVNVLNPAEINPKSSDKDSSDEDGSIVTKKYEMLIIQYLKSQDLQKVSDALYQNYGYQIEWTTHSIKQMLLSILKKSINKVAYCLRRKAIKRNDCENYGRDEMVKELLESDQTELKQKLVSYYLEKGMEYFKANEIYKMLKEFYVRNHLDVSLPKVEKKEEENWEAEKEEMAEEHNESADNREQLSATNTEDKSAVIKYEEEEIYFEEEDEPCQSKIEYEGEY